MHFILCSGASLPPYNWPYTQHLPAYTPKNTFAAGYYQLLCVTLHLQKDLYLE